MISGGYRFLQLIVNQSICIPVSPENTWWIIPMIGCPRTATHTSVVTYWSSFSEKVKYFVSFKNTVTLYMSPNLKSFNSIFHFTRYFTVVEKMSTPGNDLLMRQFVVRVTEISGLKAQNYMHDHFNSKIILIILDVHNTHYIKIWILDSLR